MQHPRCASPGSDQSWSDKDWIYIIYARVLLQMVEDLVSSSKEHQANAVRWFGEELFEVALVCALCNVRPVYVYIEVARRLRAAKIRSRHVDLIRWQLRSGRKLSEIPVWRLDKAAVVRWQLRGRGLVDLMPTDEGEQLAA
jgi:hypothetical protein